MGLSWLETMQINLLAGGEDTAAPLTLFQDHPRLPSRSPHAASTQRKTFNWVINYITNKSPSWFFSFSVPFSPPLFLSEAAFGSLVDACWCSVGGEGRLFCDFILKDFFLLALLSLYSILQTEPFQKPVSLEQHPDYAEYIFHPMDLCTLEKVRWHSAEALSLQL